MPLDLLIGPAGSGKDAAAIAALATDTEVLVDLSLLSTAVYPHRAGEVRTPAMLAYLRRLRAAALAIAADQELGGFVTMADSADDSIDKMRQRAGGRVFVIDPGRATVAARLALSQRGRGRQCAAALSRWYRPGVDPKGASGGSWRSPGGRSYPTFRGRR